MKKLYMILPLVLVLCFVYGCQDKVAMAELEAMKAQAEVEEQNKDLVNRMWEAWNNGDFEAFKELYTPDYFSYFPSINPNPLSLEETTEFAKMVHNAFPDIIFSIEEFYAVEDRVISRFIMRGSHEGEFQGIPATGNKVEFSGIIISHIKNGKIEEEREDLDMLGFMQQLGMELKPKEEK